MDIGHVFSLEKAKFNLENLSPRKMLENAKQVVFPINRNQFKQIIKNNVLLPAFIFDKKCDANKAFEDHIDAGANVIVAPTYLYNNEKDKKRILKETVGNCAH